MVIKKVSEKWWTLKSDGFDGSPNLIFFGRSQQDVMHRFRRYIREYDLEKIRYFPKGYRT